MNDMGIAVFVPYIILSDEAPDEVALAECRDLGECLA